MIVVLTLCTVVNHPGGKLLPGILLRLFFYALIFQLTGHWRQMSVMLANLCFNDMLSLINAFKHSSLYIWCLEPKYRSGNVDENAKY